jgi:uncharacterized SAM-binding protein YcdF (DUF218 family)
MFFVLSKTVSLLLLPSNFLIGIGIVGVVLLATRWRRIGVRLMAASIVLLVLAAWLPIAGPLERVLETRFPPWDPARGVPDGIIVLGGAIDPTLSRIYGTTQVIESAERVTVIAKLAHDYPKARIVYSGGVGSLLGDEDRESHYVGQMIATFGVPPGRVMMEDRSNNTYQNAVYTKALVDPKPGEHWLLVTSAWHMARAVGCFRQVGFPVEAYPVDWRVEPHFRFSLNRRLGGGLAALDDVTHEWLGLFAYWITGRTSSFFPAPAPAH